jgi:hypothetical protein
MSIFRATDDWTSVAPLSGDSLTWAARTCRTRSASTSGFLGSDLATPRTLAIGDNFTILAGDVDLSLAPIAA